MLLKLSHISCRKYQKMMYCSKKPKKPKSQRLLRLCLAPPSQESLRFRFFEFFGTVLHLGLVMVKKFGTALAKCMVLKKDPAQLQCSGGKPRSHVLLRANGRHSHKIVWDSFFLSFRGQCLILHFFFVSIMCFSNEIWHSTSFLINI